MLEYLPLKPHEELAKLVIENDEDDKLFYELSLIAKPAPPEKITHVETNLGYPTVFSLKIKNYARVLSDFILTVRKCLVM